MSPFFAKILNRLAPLTEAGDTFARTPATVTPSAPHVRDSIDQKRLMVFVIYALVPALLFGIWNTGRQAQAALGAPPAFIADFLRGAATVLPIILVSYFVGGFWEVLFAVVRRHEINEGFLVTGLLFPLVLPPTIPLWQVAAGISFGVVIGKEVFGGVGYNLFNPALVGRAFLFFAYPAQMTGLTVWVASASDAVTQATPLAVAADSSVGSALTALNTANYTLWDLILGTVPGCIGSTSVIAILLGMGFLLVTGIASWRVIVAGLVGCIATAGLFSMFPSQTEKTLPIPYHLAMGGFLFGLIFMATDPVSCAATRIGKWVYGFLIGALTVLVRVANPAFPDGTMLAILFMNAMAPLIDHAVVRAHIRRRIRHARALNHA